MLFLVACHRPQPLTVRMRTLGSRIAGAVKPVAANVHVQVDGRALAAAAAQQAMQQQGPIEFKKTVRHTSGGDSTAAPAPTTSPTPTVTTTRTTGPSLVAVMRSTTRGGAHACSTYPTMDQCKTECTNTLRMSMMSTDPGATQSCSCLEASGC
ncbi:MAG TPA: hypothetical protein VFQ53_26600 [Kofleriaceae bacterium]|nr:hypothetical protein [Kofleriaceae bacterium]